MVKTPSWEPEVRGMPVQYTGQRGAARGQSRPRTGDRGYTPATFPESAAPRGGICRGAYTLAHPESNNMNTKKIVTGTLVGGVVLYAVGFILFQNLFADFYDANSGNILVAGSRRAANLVGYDLFATMAYAGLIVYALRNRAASASLAADAQAGAIVGLLLWTTADFSQYASSNNLGLSYAIVDPLLEMGRGAIAAVSITAVLKKMA